MLSRLLLLVLFFAFFGSGLGMAQSLGLVYVRNGKFFLESNEYRFLGVNYWPAAYLGMKESPGDQNRLKAELDFLASKGITNLRVLISSEGDGTYPFRISPSFQETQGAFNEEVLQGLDYLLQQCGRRNLKVVLYFTNQWEWSGGFGQYLEWNGLGKTPLPKTEGWDWSQYRDYTAQFYTCASCISKYNNLVNQVVTRKNSITGVLYKNDPTIFAWELANEPRPMRPLANEAYLNWIASSSALIKKLDSNHLLTIGSEGDVSAENNMDIYEKAHTLTTVDYLTIHIWPKNWKWFPDTNIAAHMLPIVDKSQKFLDKHLAIARKLKKPLVLEEFGLPRDAHRFAKETSVSSRNTYYQWGMDQWVKNQALPGVCFWAFGGLTPFPSNGEFWQKGEPFRGDPPSEEQGLNSIYGSDSTTWHLINSYKNR